MAINRDTFKKSFRTEDVQIESLGETVTLRQFSAADRLKLWERFGESRDAEGTAQRAVANQRVASKVIQLTLVDEDGNRIYGDDELDALESDMHGDVLDELGEAAMRFAGLVDEDDEPRSKK